MKGTKTYKAGYYWIFIYICDDNTSFTYVIFWRNNCCLYSRLFLGVILSDWLKDNCHQCGRAHGRVMCPVEKYGATDNILFMRADSFVLLFVFTHVHKRKCNYGAQPPPLTHANMHYNWPIHTGKVSTEWVAYFQPAANHYI